MNGYGAVIKGKSVPAAIWWPPSPPRSTNIIVSQFYSATCTGIKSGFHSFNEIEGVPIITITGRVIGIIKLSHICGYLLFISSFPSVLHSASVDSKQNDCFGATGYMYTEI